MDLLHNYLPRRVNSGPWLTAWTLFELRERVADARLVLPLCSLGTPFEELESLGDFVLPPLYHEALDDELKPALLKRIGECFPFYHESRAAAESSAKLQVVELPRQSLPNCPSPRVLGFSVDTAVEEHGPHLPLATDTIQSYAVLNQLADDIEGFVAGPPVEYGHLTWGLPFGLSIDLTPPLLTRYVTAFANAVLDWLKPDAVYVGDVHGSIVHRKSIIAGLEASRLERWAFRWFYEPLIEFSSERGDQHAGGVETALVERAGEQLVDRRWFPDQVSRIEDGQMTLERAVELTADLPRFIEFAETTPANGIVGKIRNYDDVDASLMFDRMLDTARHDVETLLAGDAGKLHRDAGDSPWERDKL